ncbi:hypothetical protein N865_21320 [Intrasporangium oryzae NRRL B-24470]|uniref:Uncharacterized protein n=1 Tax=Intrasporangium oryzae NRRL B-24470 TaxID=1386089 RepID=W9G3V7_9MICO|nr:hypothetical protein [Intrasporangium oryzae]EWT00690.1 hypothetical protein N865_21320 [Intrasporangium oryzae NRRL B-24470]
MAGKTKVVTTVIKYGTKYGPQIWIASKALREPAKEAAQKIMASERARKAALSHASSLADGSVLKVYRGDQALWLVFSGDTAITVYPPTDVPLSSLLRGADLTRRIHSSTKLTAKDRAKDAAATALRRGKPGSIN